MKRAERIAAMQAALGLFGYMAEYVVDHLENEGCAIYRKRRQHSRRRPVSSKPMTARLAGQIRRRAERYPSHTQSQLAAHYGVNIGRISEALAWQA